MKTHNILLFFVLCFLACNHQKQEVTTAKFDKTKWATRHEKEYPYRDIMLKDLMGNKRLTGIKRDSVITMLGEPTRSDTNYIFYRVSQTLLGDFLPLHTKTLVIEFAEDSTVRSAKIHE